MHPSYLQWDYEVQWPVVLLVEKAVHGSLPLSRPSPLQHSWSAALVAVPAESKLLREKKRSVLPKKKRLPKFAAALVGSGQQASWSLQRHLYHLWAC